MISSPTNSNPLVIEIHHEINKIMQSDESKQDQKIRIMRIIKAIISNEETTVQIIESSQRENKELSGKNEDLQSKLKEKNEEIAKLSKEILRLNKENSSTTAFFGNIQLQLDQANTSLNEIRSDLEKSKKELETVKESEIDLSRRLEASSSQYTEADRQLQELRGTQFSDGIRIRGLEEENGNLNRRIDGLNTDKNNLTVKVNVLEENNIKLLAEREEVKRLKKLFIEYTLVRSFFPNWPERVGDEFAKKGFFFTYLNPISSTPWLNLCDQQSLKGREHNITIWLERERKDYPHLTEFEALTQLLRRINYGCLIRDEKTYIEEYKTSHNIK